MNKSFYPLLLGFILLFTAFSCSENKSKKSNMDKDNEKYDHLLLVGTYTTNVSKGIYLYQLNTSNGESKLVSETEIENPSYLTLSADEKYVYAVSEMAEDGASATAFSLNKEDGKLGRINSQKTGDGSCFVSVDKSRKLLLTANYNDGSISSLVINKDGSLGKSETQYFSGNGAHPTRQEQPHLHQIIFSPDERFVFANDLGTDHIYKATVENAEGGLSPFSPHAVKGGSGPRHSTFHPNGKFLYMLGELSGEIFTFAYNEESGDLSEIQTIEADSLKAGGSADIHIVPNGKFLYASNRLKGDGIVIFQIDEETGILSKIGYQETGTHPRNFTITPNGKLLLVANKDSNTIQIFGIEENGLLTNLNQDIKVSSPTCLKLATLN